MKFKNLSQVEEWRNEIGLVYTSMIGAGFPTTDLNLVAQGGLGTVEVGVWRAALDRLVEAVDAFDAGTFADAILWQAELTYPVLDLDFDDAIARLKDGLKGDASDLRAEASALKNLVADADPNESMASALDGAFDGAPAGTTDGPDVQTGGPGKDVVKLGDGDDVFDGEGGNDVIKGGAGIDRLFGGDGKDKIFGDGGNDRVVGDAGRDKLWGGAGDDEMYGDSMTVGGGTGAAADRMRGGKGDDDMKGQGGDDRMWGNAGGDEMDGGEGNDRLKGGGGDDVIEGGAGNDRMWGNGGRDVFVFDGEGRDVVKDFRDDVDTLQIDLASAPADEQAWLEANSDVVKGKLVIEVGDGELVLGGIRDWRQLVDDIDFI